MPTAPAATIATEAARLSVVIQRTAGAICAVLDMLSAGKLPQSGLIRQEDIKLPAFLANRFGRCYAMEPPAAAHAA